MLCSLIACSVHVEIAHAQTLDKTAVEAIVRETILNKPEIIEEALQKLQAKSVAEKQARMKTMIVENAAVISGDQGFHAVVGNPKGSVSLVEFSDYNCGYCRKALGDLQEVMKADPDLRVVLKELPVIARESEGAAKISIQLRKEPKFFEYHQKLFTQTGRISQDTALKVAKEMGFDADRLKAGAESARVKEEIEQSFMLAQVMDVQGTPTYVIGDTVLYGAVGVEKLKSTIANVRKCGKGEGCK